MIPLAAMKARLGLTGTVDDTTENTAVLSRYVEGATAALGRELGRYLGTPQEQDEIRHGGPWRGVPVLFLFNEPTADTTLTVYVRPGPTDPWALVEETEYVLEGRALRHASTWPQGRANVRIVYTAGIPVGEGPEELVELVAQLVSLRWGARKENPAMQSESLGDYAYTRKDMDGLKDWAATAGRWRVQLV